MKRHTLVSTILNISLVLLALTAWTQEIGANITLIDIASLLGVIAFSLMYVHYAADAVTAKQDDGKDMQYIASRVAVLVAILAHPLLINIYLVTNGFGLPPSSYEKFVGSTLPVLLGWTALAAFLSFEIKGKLKRFARYIFHANILAMFLIFMHGFLIGMIIMSGWYIWVWWFMLITFTLIALKSYMSYYKGAPRYYVALVFVIAMFIITASIGVNETQKQIAAHAIALLV